jgi:hypothetical protein
MLVTHAELLDMAGATGTSQAAFLEADGRSSGIELKGVVGRAETAILASAHAAVAA